jgi:hypothetical protein
MTNATTIQTKKANRYLAGLMAALATMAAIVALCAISAHASAEQGADLQRSVSGSSKKAAAATTSSTSTTPKASFASDSGANFLGVKVSDHGNLMSFESPQGQEQVFDGQEGYAVCNSGGGSFGHDTGSVESGFGPPTFSQPNGAGTFPLTVTRKTTDGKLKLTQVWNKPDPVEKDVTVTMTVTNLSSNPLFGLGLSRSGDFDIGNSGVDQGAKTADSAWQWNDADSSADTPPGGTMLTALTPGTKHVAQMDARAEWLNAGRTKCFDGSVITPTSTQDLAMRMAYTLGDFNGGQSKTVKFEYGLM